MAATRASGTNAVRYGTMRDNVLSLTAVMADGSVVTTGKRAKKSSAGYDLTRLADRLGRHARHHHLADAEARRHSAGDLGRRLPVPRCRGGLPGGDRDDPDGHSGRAHRAGQRAADARDEELFRSLDYPESPCLFVEFHGSDAGVAEQAETFGEIAAEYGGGPFLWTSVAEERTKLWKARHDAYWASLTLRPGARGLRPMSACRSRGLPNASPRPRPTSPRWG